MKKLIGTIFLIITWSISFAQAKKPTIMIVPSDNWCFQNGFIESIDDQGTTRKIPNYKKALQENSEVLNVISKLNGLMADRGFPLKNLETVLKGIENDRAEDALTVSKSGSGISETNIDKIKRVAKADIIMQLSWTINRNGPNKSITFNLQGLDAYSMKQVATAQGTGSPSMSSETIVLLEEAVLAHLDNFNATLQKHFDDMFENGREIVIKIKKFSSWDGDLEKEYGNKELGSIIEDWLSKNTVKGRFSTTDATADQMFFEQVRIPLYENERALDARGFCKKLQNYLKEAPFSIVNKLTTNGLGNATIILGEK